MAFQVEIAAQIGKAKRELVVYAPPEAILNEITEFALEKVQNVLHIHEKLEREEALEALRAEVNQLFIEKYPDNKKDISYVFQKLVKKTMRKMITVDNIRPDSRAVD